MLRCPALVDALASAAAAGARGARSLAQSHRRRRANALFGGLGARALPALCTLRLDSNRIGDDGASLAHALKRGRPRRVARPRRQPHRRPRDSVRVAASEAAHSPAWPISTSPVISSASATPPALPPRRRDARGRARGRPHPSCALCLSGNRIGDRGARARQAARGGGGALREPGCATTASAVRAFATSRPPLATRKRRRPLHAWARRQPRHGRRRGASARRPTRRTSRLVMLASTRGRRSASPSGTARALLGAEVIDGRPAVAARHARVHQHAVGRRAAGRRADEALRSSRAGSAARRVPRTRWYGCRRPIYLQ